MKLSIPAVIPEALAGHEQYLDEAYQRYTTEQLGEYYKKAEQKITILESQPDLTEVHEQMKEKDKQISTMQQEMHNLRNQIGGFQKIIEDPEFRIEIMNMMAKEWEKLQQEKKKA